MVRTKQRVSQHYTKEIPVEDSSTEEEMATAPIEGSLEEESTVEDTAVEEDTTAEEEAPRW